MVKLNAESYSILFHQAWSYSGFLMCPTEPGDSPLLSFGLTVCLISTIPSHGCARLTCIQTNLSLIYATPLV